MICCLCMSRKHRASHCPLKAAAAASHRVHPHEQGNDASDLRNIHIESVTAVQGPSTNHPGVTYDNEELFKYLWRGAV